jgi:ketosteroid isomerase-like protein
MELNPPNHEENEKDKDNEIIAREYFKRIKSGDVHGLLELFSDDSVIYEPFSRSKRLSGKSEIEPFLKSVIMANEGLQYEIEIVKQNDNHKKRQNNILVALVIFRKDNEIRSRFTFGFEKSDGFKLVRRIKSLLIEFID